MCQAIQTLYQLRHHCADCLFQPQRYCHRQWADLTAFTVSDSRKCVHIIRLIVAFIPLTIATLCSYLLVPVGLLLKACTMETIPKTVKKLEFDKNASVQKPAPHSITTPLQQRTHIPKAAEEAFKANASHVACVSNAHFFFGACDKDLEGGASDLGWGCAWRCIQSCIASYDIFYRFQDLYNAYHIDNTTNEWAEPGYGARVCRAHGISYQLYLYQFKRTPKTPKQEYNDTELTTFKTLCAKLFEHFKTHQTPVMVDDGAYAYTLLGIKEISNNQTVFWIADPHKTSLDAALYTLVLDETGEVLHCTGIDDGSNGLKSSQRVTLKSGLMLLFPQ